MEKPVEDIARRLATHKITPERKKQLDQYIERILANNKSRKIYNAHQNSDELILSSLSATKILEVSNSPSKSQLTCSKDPVDPSCSMKSVENKENDVNHSLSKISESNLPKPPIKRVSFSSTINPLCDKSPIQKNQLIDSPKNFAGSPNRSSRMVETSLQKSELSHHSLKSKNSPSKILPQNESLLKSPGRSAIMLNKSLKMDFNEEKNVTQVISSNNLSKSQQILNSPVSDKSSIGQSNLQNTFKEPKSYHSPSRITSNTSKKILTENLSSHNLTYCSPKKQKSDPENLNITKKLNESSQNIPVLAKSINITQNEENISLSETLSARGEKNQTFKTSEESLNKEKSLLKKVIKQKISNKFVKPHVFSSSEEITNNTSIQPITPCITRNAAKAFKLDMSLSNSSVFESSSLNAAYQSLVSNPRIVSKSLFARELPTSTKAKKNNIEFHRNKRSLSLSTAALKNKIPKTEISLSVVHDSENRNTESVADENANITCGYGNSKNYSEIYPSSVENGTCGFANSSNYSVNSFNGSCGFANPENIVEASMKNMTCGYVMYEPKFIHHQGVNVLPLPKTKEICIGTDIQPTILDNSCQNYPPDDSNSNNNSLIKGENDTSNLKKDVISFISPEDPFIITNAKKSGKNVKEVKLDEDANKHDIISFINPEDSFIMPNDQKLADLSANKNNSSKPKFTIEEINSMITENKTLPNDDLLNNYKNINFCDEGCEAAIVDKYYYLLKLMIKPLKSIKARQRNENIRTIKFYVAKGKVKVSNRYGFVKIYKKGLSFQIDHPECYTLLNLNKQNLVIVCELVPY